MKGVDLFAGLGGFTLAAKACGVAVLWAANHWAAAVNVHRQNHPETIHACQDLHQANWEAVPGMDLVLASPSCQGHTKARGKDRPRHDKARSTSWAVVSCVEHHRPFGFILENVPEFLQWILFAPWKAAMEALGYALSIQTFDAADAGVPQNRVRTFVVGVKGRTPLIIPPPSALAPTAASIIDWTAGRWAPVRKRRRAKATLQRIQAGRRRFGERFLVPFYGSGSGLTGRSLDRPIGTITTVARWAAVDGDRMRMLSPAECRRAMGFPETYVIPASTPLAIHMLGNAVPPPLAAHVIREFQRAA